MEESLCHSSHSLTGHTTPSQSSWTQGYNNSLRKEKRGGREEREGRKEKRGGREEKEGRKEKRNGKGGEEKEGRKEKRNGEGVEEKEERLTEALFLKTDFSP